MKSVQEMMYLVCALPKVAAVLSAVSAANVYCRIQTSVAEITGEGDGGSHHMWGGVPMSLNGLVCTE